MGNRTLRVAAAVAVVLVAVFATVGEGSSSNSGNKAPNASSNSDSTKPGHANTPKEGADKAQPIPVGTEIKVSSGWDFKVNSVELNANAKLQQANQFNTPDDGKQFVLVNVSMSNKSGKPDSPLTNLKVSLLPPSGVAISSDFASVTDQCDSTTQLQPDAVYTCNEIFQVNVADADTSLLLVEPQFTIHQNDAQRFFSLK